MIDLVLKQFREVAFSLESLIDPTDIPIIDANLRSPRDTHHQIGKAEAVIPQLETLLAFPDNLRVEERSTKTRRLHSYEDHSLQDAKLRRGDSPAVPRRLAKRGESIAQVADNSAGFAGLNVGYDGGLAPEHRIAEL